MNIAYGKQEITDEDINEVVQVLKSSHITQGPKIKEFEDKVAKFHGCKYAVAFTNGTAALHGAYFATGIKSGEEFITSPITFAASANGGLYTGATVRFIDINPMTYNMDIEKLSKAISDNTRVITPVAYAGFPVDIKRIREIIGEKDIKIIYDAAHAIGAKLNNSKLCDIADMVILSFHPVKHITTGEGGMVLTNCEKLYSKLIQFRTHGITKNSSEYVFENQGGWYHEMQFLGYNYRLSDINAALGNSQMDRIEENLVSRNRVAERYFEALKDIKEIMLPKYFDTSWTKLHSCYETEENLCSYHLFPILLATEKMRKELFEYLMKNSIYTQVHYIPVHLHPYYQNDLGYRVGDFPYAEEFYKRELSIPMFHSLTQEEQEYVIGKIKAFFQQ